jgi:hypothetical protein
MVFGQMRREDSGLVDAPGALPVTLHFLQGDNVGVLDLARDASEVVSVILTEAVLNVIADAFHLTATHKTAASSQRATRRPTFRLD